MSNDLSTQLSEYFGHVDATQGAVDVLDLVHPEQVRELPRPEPVPGRRTRRGLLVAAATAVIVLLLAIPFLLSRSEPQETPPATTPSTLTTEATPNTAPTTEPEPNEAAGSGRPSIDELPVATSAGWQWIPTGLTSYRTGGMENIEGFSIGQFPDGTYFAWSGGWLEGSRYDGEQGDDPTETLLLSNDGRTWATADVSFLDGFISAAHFSYGWGTIRAVPPPAGTTDLLSNESEHVFWTSEDGLDWFAIDPIGLGTWHQVGKTIVVKSGSGFAVSDDGGRSFDLADSDPTWSNRNSDLFTSLDSFRLLTWSNAAPILWSSQDGRVWTELGPVPDLDQRRSDGSFQIASLGGGRVLYAGVQDIGYQAPTYLISEDGGLNWSQLNTAPRAPSNDSVHTLGDWLVARTRGSVGDDLLVTQDGSQWFRLDRPGTDGPFASRFQSPENAQINTNLVSAAIEDEDGGLMLWIAVPPSE